MLAVENLAGGREDQPGSGNRVDHGLGNHHAEAAKVDLGRIARMEERRGEQVLRDDHLVGGRRIGDPVRQQAGQPARLLARRDDRVLLALAQEMHPILDVLEEVSLLDEQVLVEDLEELPVPDDVRGADLDAHGVELVDCGLPAEVVEGPTNGDLEQGRETVYLLKFWAAPVIRFISGWTRSKKRSFLILRSDNATMPLGAKRKFRDNALFSGNVT